MSTILKALKKVEGKRAASDVKLDMPETPAVHRIKSHDGLKWIVAAGLLLMVALSAAAGRHFWQTDKPTPSAQKVDGAGGAADEKETQPSTSDTPLPQEILPDKAVIQPVPAVPDLPLNKAEKAEETIYQKPLPKKSNARSLPSAPNLPPKKADEKMNTRQRSRIAPLVKKEPPQTAMVKTESKNRTQPQRRPKAIGPPDTWPKAGSAVERKPEKPDAPLLDDRSLEIQALVYSEDATKRMVVLNGEVLRMGYEYKGYIIESIESQWILVRKNGKVSALTFGH